LCFLQDVLASESADLAQTSFPTVNGLGGCETDSQFCWQVRGDSRLPASFVQLRRPVLNHGHGCAVTLLHLRVNQKSLAIPAHVVDEQVIHQDGLPGCALEKDDGGTGIEMSPVVTGAAIIFPSKER
jgi:hypothetical protein